jgi:S-DNA-T family DNA segregation ATPase FtsK/SpoIIIE
MADGPRTAQARELLRLLKDLCAWRAEAEVRVVQERDAALAAAEAAFAEASRSQEESLERELRAAEEEYTSGRDRVIAAATETLAKVRASVQAEVNQLRERAEADKVAAKKRLQDDTWMAETLHDSARTRSREAFETTRKAAEKSREELRQVRAHADAIMLRLAGLGDRNTPEWMQPPAPVTSGLPTTPPAVPDKDRGGEGEEGEGAVRRVEEQWALVTQRIGGLERQFVASMLTMPLPIIYGILGGVAAAAGTAWARGWVLDGVAVYVGVAGLGVSMAVALWLWRWSRNRLLSRARPLYAAMNECELAIRAMLDEAAFRRAAADERARLKLARSVGASRERYEAVRAELQEELQRRSTELQARAAAQEAEARAVRDAELTRLERERESRLSAARQEAAWRVQSIAASFVHAKKEAQQRFEAAWSELERRWREGCARVHAGVNELRAFEERTCIPWESPVWSQAGGDAWTPNRVNPMAVRFGRVGVDVTALPGGLPQDERLRTDLPTTFTLPGLLEFPDRCSLLIQAGGEPKPAAHGTTAGTTPGTTTGPRTSPRQASVGLLQAVMLRLLTTLPPGKVRFTIIDPVGLGQNFAGFMHLADHDPLLVSDRIWTEPRHIEQKLTDLTEHMENVIQKYLRNQFASIEEYNDQAGEIAEPYRFLVIADFPAGFNEQAAKRLASILTSGPRCGVYTLIALDPRAPLPQGVTTADLRTAAVRLNWRQEQARGGAGAPPGAGRLVWDDPDFGGWPLTTEGVPDEVTFNRIVGLVGRAARDSGRVEVPFASIAPRDDEFWTGDSAGEFSVRLGKCGATKLQSLVLGRGTAQHALIAGRTGSGKSTLLHAIITNAAMWYSPDQVEMYLIDFKKGVEFKTYATHALPHARVVAIESEREFGLSVLRRLDAELKRRGELFREAEVQDLRSFRAARPGERMPRVLLIVDEFQELFVEDDKIASEAGLLLDRLVRQGRAFGMHVVLGSQTLGGAYSLARSTIGQMAVRIALQCSEADALLIMGDDNTAPRLLSRPGEAIYNDASGAIEGNSPFQVSWLPDSERDTYLERIEQLTRERLRPGAVNPIHPVPPPIVFEGNVPADLSRNPLLNALLEADAWPEPRPGAPTIGQAWLGDAVAIKDPTAAVFRRQSSANLLIVGQKDEAAVAMMGAAMIGLAAQHAPSEGVRFVVLDGTPLDAPHAGTLERVAAIMPHDRRVVAYRDVPGVIREIYDEVRRREDSDQTDAPPVYVFVHALQRFRALRRPENEFDFSAEAGEEIKPERAFAVIIREGPPVGIHVLTWCDTVASLQRALDRNAIREFDSRVLFQMSSADSSTLIDAPVAGVIGQNRALFYSEELGVIEKFRPYAPLTSEYLDRVRRVFAARMPAAPRSSGQTVRTDA